MKDIINDLKKSDTGNIHLMVAITIMSFKDNNEEHVIHSQSSNLQIMINDKADEVIDELFQILLSRYQSELETSIKGSDFIFDCVYLLYYKLHKIYSK